MSAITDVGRAAAVEFALILPVLCLLYAVGFEICQAATVNRKLTDTTVQAGQPVVSVHQGREERRFYDHERVFADDDPVSE